MQKSKTRGSHYSGLVNSCETNLGCSLPIRSYYIQRRTRHKQARFQRDFALLELWSERRYEVATFQCSGLWQLLSYFQVTLKSLKLPHNLQDHCQAIFHPISPNQKAAGNPCCLHKRLRRLCRPEQSWRTVSSWSCASALGFINLHSVYIERGTVSYTYIVLYMYVVCILH